MPDSVADELAKLAHLRDTGVLTDTEFEAEKAKVLRGAAPLTTPAAPIPVMTRPTLAANPPARPRKAMRWPFVVLLLIVAVAIIAAIASSGSGSGSPGGSEQTTTTITATASSASPGTLGPVPNVTNQELDQAEATLLADNLGYNVVGGGTFGVVVAANWTVCSQSPGAGSSAASVTLVVARSCS